VAGAAVPPETRYARVGPDRLAYQVLGQGPPDLVLTMGAFSHVDIVWEDPQTALFLRRLASFCRLLRFDRRGTGASDPLPPDPLPWRLVLTPDHRALYPRRRPGRRPHAPGSIHRRKPEHNSPAPPGRVPRHRRTTGRSAHGGGGRTAGLGHLGPAHPALAARRAPGRPSSQPPHLTLKSQRVQPRTHDGQPHRPPSCASPVARPNTTHSKAHGRTTRRAQSPLTAGA